MNQDLESTKLQRILELRPEHIITTNFDNLLEKAFKDASHPGIQNLPGK
ncbi:MAG: SIR2 family protein [Lewinellaceae bacterium]|nr:SIR2 family protein [Lewinellaceae bacterium]